MKGTTSSRRHGSSFIGQQNNPCRKTARTIPFSGPTDGWARAHLVIYLQQELPNDHATTSEQESIIRASIWPYLEGLPGLKWSKSIICALVCESEFKLLYWVNLRSHPVLRDCEEKWDIGPWLNTHLQAICSENLPVSYPDYFKITGSASCQGRQGGREWKQYQQKSFSISCSCMPCHKLLDSPRWILNNWV